MVSFKKSWKKYLLILLLGGLSIWVYLKITAYREEQHQIEQLAQNDAGICIKEGRVLTEAEHRKAFLRSLAKLYIDSIDDTKERGVYTGAKVGIIKNTERLDFVKLLGEFFNNGKSFLENFDIEEFYPRASLDIDQLQEPFILVSYNSDRQNAKVVFTGSRDLIRLDEKTSKIIRDKYPPGLYERYQGFGNYYYKDKITFIDIECCNNKNYFDTQEDYLKAKTKAYLDSIWWQGKTGPKITKGIIITSNCGDIFAPALYGNKEMHRDYTGLSKEFGDASN